jgi:predicted NUDIX family phosphoesterase
MIYSGVLNLHVDRELNACVGVSNTDLNLLVDRELNACVGVSNTDLNLLVDRELNACVGVGVSDTRNHDKHDLIWSS